MVELDSVPRENRRHWPPVLTGLSLAVLCFAIRLTCAADEFHSSFLGRPLGTDCAFRLRFGIPCPNCGLTRAIILALHGEWIRAWRIAPSGPALLFTMLASAAVVLTLGIVRMRGAAPLVAQAERITPRIIYACVALALVVWTGGWIAAVAHASAVR